MSKTKYNLRQQQTRLSREIAHFTSQTAKFIGNQSPQGKRCFTRAIRALTHRLDELEKIQNLLIQ